MAEIVIVGCALVAILALILAVLTVMSVASTRRVARSQREAIRSAEELEATARRLLQDLQRDPHDR